MPEKSGVIIIIWVQAKNYQTFFSVLKKKKKNLTFNFFENKLIFNFYVTYLTYELLNTIYFDKHYINKLMKITGYPNGYKMSL